MIQKIRGKAWNAVEKFVKFFVGKWPEFGKIGKFSKPYRKEAGNRVACNLKYFWWNYVVVEIVIALALAQDVAWMGLPWALPVGFGYCLKNCVLGKAIAYWQITLCMVLAVACVLITGTLALKIIGVAGAATLVHSLYHDYPTVEHNDP